MWSVRSFAIFAILAAIDGRALPLSAQNPVRLSEPPQRPASLTASDLETWLDGWIPAALVSGDIAGLVLSVVKDGQLLFAKGYGYADVAKRIPMDPERTLIHVASISKSFTATAVMQLVEQGRLDLDRDINDYLDFTIPPAFGRPITLRHLLTHTAGFEEPSYKRYAIQRTLRQEVLTVPDRIYPPGEFPAYSNYGLNLAGYVVEPWVRLIQLVGLLCIGGVGVAGWNVWLTWRGARGGWAQLGSLISLLALGYLGWCSFAFHLISIQVS